MTIGVKNRPMVIMIMGESINTIYNKVNKIMTIHEHGFKCVVAFENPIMIGDYLIYGLFMRESREELTQKDIKQIETYLAYLLSVQQIIEKGGYISDDKNDVCFVGHHPTRLERISVRGETMKFVIKLMRGLVKYTIYHCPPDLEIKEDEIDCEDPNLIISKDLIEDIYVNNISDELTKRIKIIHKL